MTPVALGGRRFAHPRLAPRVQCYEGPRLQDSGTVPPMEPKPETRISKTDRNSKRETRNVFEAMKALDSKIPVRCPIHSLFRAACEPLIHNSGLKLPSFCLKIPPRCVFEAMKSLDSKILVHLP